jgi:Helix-turn-helix domain
MDPTPADAAAAGEVRALPEVLTVEEAAAVLRIGRRLAYEQAQLFRETRGREGLPVLVIGRCLRVPRSALEELLGLSGVSRALQAEPGASSLPARPEPRPRPRSSGLPRTASTKRRSLPSSPAQPQSPLPFTT